MAILGVLAAILFKPRFSPSYVLKTVAAVAGSATAAAMGRHEIVQTARRAPTDDIMSGSDTAFDEYLNESMVNKSFEKYQFGEFLSSSRQVPDTDEVVTIWKNVLGKFYKGIPIQAFAVKTIVLHYESDKNNILHNCMLIRIRDGHVNITKSFSPSRHSRYTSVVYMLQKVLSGVDHQIPDVTFLVMLNDGHMPLVPTLGVARHWESWRFLVPVPMGNTRGESAGWGTPLEDWDKYISDTVVNTHEKFPWITKIPKAVFRGALLMQTWKLGSCNAENNGSCERANRWTDVARGAMYRAAQNNSDMFDIAFTKHGLKTDYGFQQFEGAPEVERGIPFHENQRYKYVLNVGSNQDWAERLRSLLFMNSAIVIHQAETKEFYHPLLVPWKHYIPTDLLFTDLNRNVQWAKEHDSEVQDIVQNMNSLAKTFLSEKSMQCYWKLALTEYAFRQRLADKLSVNGHGF